MILSREIIKEIEQHFYNNADERRRLDEMAADIAERGGMAVYISGVRSSGVSDPTAQRAAQLERESRVLRGWADVVQKTYARFHGTPYADLMVMVFIERQAPSAIQDALYISEATYFNWKSDVMQFAAMKACEAGLIEV